MRAYVRQTLSTQVMEFVPWSSFARIVQRHGGNPGVHTLACADQLPAMAFAQLTWHESLRDIEASLSANSPKLRLHQSATFFVTRAKRGMDARRVYS